jgi:benzodiazapine receptor
MKTNTKKIIIVLSLAVTLGVNYLANILPLNGNTTGAVSDMFPQYIVPLGYVFSIWGLIYLSLTGYAINNFFYNKQDKLVESTFPWFVTSCICNCAWIFLWHYMQFGLTIVAMLGLLGSLIMIYINTNKADAKRSFLEKLLYEFPFSLYLGWVSVATIVNVSVVLSYIGWDGFGINPAIWSVILISVATSLGLYFLKFRNDITFALVIVWAVTGIGLRFVNNEQIIFGAAVVSVITILASVAMHKLKY